MVIYERVRGVSGDSVGNVRRVSVCVIAKGVWQRTAWRLLRTKAAYIHSSDSNSDCHIACEQQSAGKSEHATQ